MPLSLDFPGKKKVDGYCPIFPDPLVAQRKVAATFAWGERGHRAVCKRILDQGMAQRRRFYWSAGGHMSEFWNDAHFGWQHFLVSLYTQPSVHYEREQVPDPYCTAD